MARKSTRERRPPKTALLEAIHRNFGNLAAVANAMGVTRKTVYNWVEHYQIWAEVNKAREQMVDLAEAKLIEKVREGDTKMIEFVLRTLGRSRGYAEAMQHSGEVRVVVTYERPE